MSITVKLAGLVTFGHPVAWEMAWDSGSGLDRKEMRTAIVDLIRIAALWEGGALRRGHAETRAADERLLRTIVKAIIEHQGGVKSVPVARVGKHLVRRVDLRLARVHERVAGILRELAGPLDNDTLDLIRAAFSSCGVKGITRERLATAIEHIGRGSEPGKWIRALKGPDQAAAELMSAVAPRSGRYVFLVKQILGKQTDPAAVLELMARGRDATTRVLTEYMLGLLRYSPRTVRRVMNVLYAPRRSPR